MLIVKFPTMIPKQAKSVEIEKYEHVYIRTDRWTESTAHHSKKAFFFFFKDTISDRERLNA